MNNTPRLIGKIYGDIILKLNNIDNIAVNDIIKHELGIHTDLEDDNYYIVTSISDSYIKLICLTSIHTEYGSEFYVGEIKQLYIPHNHSYRIFKVVNVTNINTSNIFFRSIRTIPASIIFLLILIICSIIVSYKILEPSVFLYYFLVCILITHCTIYNMYL